jgi:hypothetical protein
MNTINDNLNIIREYIDDADSDALKAFNQLNYQIDSFRNKTLQEVIDKMEEIKGLAGKMSVEGQIAIKMIRLLENQKKEL